LEIFFLRLNKKVACALQHRGQRDGYQKANDAGPDCRPAQYPPRDQEIIGTYMRLSDISSKFFTFRAVHTFAARLTAG